MTSQSAAFQTTSPGQLSPAPMFMISNPNVDHSSSPRPSKKKSTKKPTPKTPAKKK